jgi:hypothetical protein
MTYGNKAQTTPVARAATSRRPPARVSRRAVEQRSQAPQQRARAPIGFPTAEPAAAYDPSRVRLNFAEVPISAPLIQRKATISSPDSPDEREADAIAEAVLATDVVPSTHAENIGPAHTQVHRKCEECEKENTPVRAKSAPSARAGGALDVGPALSAARGEGAPLAAEARAYFEPRFNRDFSGVRIHTGQAAAVGARAVQARAYTIGSDIVFGSGEYAPASPEGRRLLAHELVHTLQQATVGPQVRRACLSGAACTGKGTLTDLVTTTDRDPVNVSKAQKRAKACNKVPRDPACTSDGHGAKASALTGLLSANYPSRLGYTAGFYVNKDIPANYGAVTHPCAAFTPPLAGGTCTSVPDKLEAQARQYNRGAQRIGEHTRPDWLTETMAILTHETEHGRFDAAAPIAERTPAACKFADHESNLSEVAARLSEMHVYYRAALARPEKDRFKRFYESFDYWVTGAVPTSTTTEHIRGIVTDLRCKCECADADHFITKTAESVSSSQKWDTNELTMIHSELRNPKWALNWPVAPPASVDANDLPNEAPVPLKLQ